MAIRKVVECDMCCNEVGDEYYTLKAREFGCIFDDWGVGVKRRFIICGECRHRIKEMLIRLEARKKEV